MKQSLASNFHSILSPPPCQVEEQETTNSSIPIEQGKGGITFCLPTDHQNNNEIATRWARRIKNRRNTKANQAALRSSFETTKRLLSDQLATITDNCNQRVYLLDNKELRSGILDRSIPSTVVDSGATSSVGMPTGPFLSTGQQSDKTFCLPNGWCVVSCKHGTQVVCVINEVRKYHSMCKVVESEHAAIETQRRIFC